jgi:hypothetical protein
MNQVVCVECHRLFRDMHHIRRARFCKSALTICAWHDIDHAIVRPDVGMTKAQSLPDPHPALVQQAQKESIPQMCAGVE